MDAIQKELSEIKKRLDDLEHPQRAAPSTGGDSDYFAQTRQLEALVRLAEVLIAALKERDPDTYRDIAGRYKRLEKNARNGVSLATEWLVPLEDS
jgi:uncharacterized protein YutE (UPF0331/DUF86 family)